jgi:ribonuclease BN (tRNA processing enzyme)
LISLAYRIDSEGKSIVIAGDTAMCDTVKTLAMDADILLIRCLHHQKVMENDTPEIAKSIMGTIKVAEMARDCRVGKLIVSHSLPDLSLPGSMEKGIGDMAKIFSGEIIFAQELQRLRL